MTNTVSYNPPSYSTIGDMQVGDMLQFPGGKAVYMMTDLTQCTNFEKRFINLASGMAYSKPNSCQVVRVRASVTLSPTA